MSAAPKQTTSGLLLRSLLVPEKPARLGWLLLLLLLLLILLVPEQPTALSRLRCLGRRTEKSACRRCLGRGLRSTKKSARLLGLGGCRRVSEETTGCGFRGSASK